MIELSSLAAADPGSLAGHFTWPDWLVLVGYFVLTTWVGHAFSGKQATIKDFFLGGRKLPWYAVTGSSIATEISAVTFIGVPAFIFAAGGNYTYMLLGIVGGLLSRVFVAVVLVPAYYKNLIYSPYDYMANQLGGGVRGVMTAMFTLGGVLAQASRVYLTAVILDIVLRSQMQMLEDRTGIDGVSFSILLIGAVAILWTLIGGIASVIWTDVVLFLVFVAGGLIALFYIITHLPGGPAELFTVGNDAGKFRLLDYSLDPTKQFTIWTALFASTLGSIGAYGTDQLMAQRMFCCANQREAKKAILFSYFGQLVTALMLLVGVGLFVYYKGSVAVGENAAVIEQGLKPAVAAMPVEQWRTPLVGESLELFKKEPDRIFPIYILTNIPPGLTGLIIAGVFAAAISSLDSILAALAQTTMSAAYLPWRNRSLQRRAVEESREFIPVEDFPTDSPEGLLTLNVSKGLVIFWGVVLSAAAFGAGAYKSAAGVPILDLALGFAAMVQGALIAAFFLAWLPLGINGRGLVWAAPLSFFTVAAARFHEPWARWMTLGVIAIAVVTWLARARLSVAHRAPRLAKTAWLMVACAVLWFTYTHGYVSASTVDGKTTYAVVAWPWWAVIGAIYAFVFGYLLADRKSIDADRVTTLAGVSSPAA
jgi:solute:Na+ symporter, SSS family